MLSSLSCTVWEFLQCRMRFETLPIFRCRRNEFGSRNVWWTFEFGAVRHAFHNPNRFVTTSRSIVGYQHLAQEGLRVPAYRAVVIPPILLLLVHFCTCSKWAWVVNRICNFVSRVPHAPPLLLHPSECYPCCQNLFFQTFGIFPIDMLIIPVHSRVFGHVLGGKKKLDIQIKTHDMFQTEMITYIITNVNFGWPSNVIDTIIVARFLSQKLHHPLVCTSDQLEPMVRLSTQSHRMR